MCVLLCVNTKRLGNLRRFLTLFPKFIDLNTTLKPYIKEVNEDLHALKLKRILKFNPFLANVPILYPLKTPIWFSGVFRGYKMGTFTKNVLMTFDRSACYSIF